MLVAHGQIKCLWIPGNLVFTGNLSGATGTFSGTLNAATINGGTINGATGYFSGNIYAANLQGQVTDGQIQSVSWGKVTAVSIDAGSITTGTMTANRISGGTLYSPYISGGQIIGSDLSGVNVFAYTVAANNLTVNSNLYMDTGSAFIRTLNVNGTASIDTLQANGGQSNIIGVRNASGTGVVYLHFTRGIFTGI